MWCSGPTNAGKLLAPAAPAPRPVAASRLAAVATTAARPAAYRLVAFISITLPSDGRCLHLWARCHASVGSDRDDSSAGNNYRRREPGLGQRRTYGYKGQGGGGGCGTTWGAGSRRLRGCAPADRAGGPGGAARAGRGAPSAAARAGRPAGAAPWLPAAAGRRRARRRAVGAAGTRLRLGLEADQGRRCDGRGGGQRRGREPPVR